MDFPDNTQKTGGFLKIAPNGNVVGVFRGKPVSYWARWSGKGSEIVDRKDKGAKFRFMINFITKEGTEWVAKVWEQSGMTYDFLKSFNKEYPLDSTFVKIIRNGDGTDTTYSFFPVKNGDVTPEMEAELSAVELMDLEAILKAKREKKTTQEEVPPPTSEDELPF